MLQARAGKKSAKKTASGAYAKIDGNSTQTGVIRELKKDNERFRTCAFSPDGGWLVATTSSNSLVLFDVNSSKVLSTQTSHKDGRSLDQVLFLPHGRGIIGRVNSNALEKWDVDAKGLMRSLNTPQITRKSDIVATHISADGKHGASMDNDGSFFHWEIDTMRTVFEHRGFDQYRLVVRRPWLGDR